MQSLEPATISGRYYPEFFQQGEAAFLKPIIDGQHSQSFAPSSLVPLYGDDPWGVAQVLRFQLGSGE